MPDLKSSENSGSSNKLRSVRSILYMKLGFPLSKMFTNLEIICRCCLLSDDEHLLTMADHLLFDANEKTSQNSNIIDSYFEICVDPSLASQGYFKICISCRQTLQTCMVFRNLCRKSNELFQNDWIKKESEQKPANIIYNDINISNEYSVSEVLIAQVKSEPESDGEKNIEEIAANTPRNKRRSSFQKLANIENQRRENVSDNVEKETHQCLKCNQHYATDKLLKRHVTKAHKIRYLPRMPDFYICRSCGLEFEKIIDFDDHVQKLHPNQSIYFPCFFCKKISSTLKGLKRLCNGECTHRQRAYKQELAGAAMVSCDCCDLKFLEEDEMHCHKIIFRNRANQSKESFFCEKCNIRFLMKFEYSDHLRNVHKQEKIRLKATVMCAVCGKTCANQNRLRLHSVAHVQSRDFKCDLCPAAFKDDRCLYNHRKIHSRVNQFQCNECNKLFGLLRNLHIHLLRCHFPSIRQYSCTICGRSLTTKTEKLRHEKTHLGERGFVCHMCNKNYASESGLQNHIQAKHTSIRYECKFCEKKLTSKQSMWKHVFVHRGYFPFCCPVCNYGCYPKELMQRHMKNKHQMQYDEMLHGYHKETINEVVASGIKIDERNACNFRGGKNSVNMNWDFDFLHQKAIEKANAEQSSLEESADEKSVTVSESQQMIHF